MIIKRLEIENFRSLKAVDVGCDELTVLLGRNGAGKSSLLYALDIFYNLSAQITTYDYFANDTSLTIKIRVTYGDLRDDELKEFNSYLKDGDLIVTKVINSGGAKYYGASKQIPEFHKIRLLGGAKEKRQEFNNLVDSGKYTDLGPKASSEKAVEEAMVKFEAVHPKLLETFEAEQQFFGPKNVGGGKLDNYTKFVLIPAVRDAVAEAEKRGAILQLIDVLVMRSINKRSDVRKLNEDFEKRIKEVYSQDNLVELRSLATIITGLLKRYAPNAELALAFGEIVPPKIPLPPAIASLIEDNFKCPIAYTGHGLQRALIFALLHQLSMTDLSPEKPPTSEGSEEVPATGLLRIPDLILGIEEPELYLHPSRSRYLSKTMDNLVKKHEKPGGPRTQIFYATHSPYFIDIGKFDRIRLARKIPADGYDVLQCQLSEYSAESAAQELAKITENDPKLFTAQSFSSRAIPVMTSMVNEGFFADVVVVVEGIGDAAVLWTIQDILGKQWDSHGIVVVPANGKNNIDRPAVVFRGLGIPTYFIFDGDSTSRKRDDAIKSNAILLRLAEAKVEDFPSTQVADKWAVFNDNLEQELKAVDEKVYLSVCDSVAGELGYDKPSAVLKNPEGASRVVKRMYELGKKIPVLEQIVERISCLK